MDLQEALEFIGSVSWKGSVPGLERITELMHRLGDPQDGLRFVHVGGTNGKGSVAAFLSHILKEAGYRTGLFISPFIEVFNERMQVDNEYISDEELAEITAYVKPFAEQMEDVPTEFELNTAIGFVYFSRHACDIVVLEVGMGGEFDATNVISCPEVAVITSIGLDHTEYLGDTIEEIAATKAGIIKPGCAVVLYRESAAEPGSEADPAQMVIKKRCEEQGARLYLSEPEKLTRIRSGLDGQCFLSEYGELEITLPAQYQRYNLAVALAAVQALKDAGYSISSEDIRQGVRETTWPGRFEILHRSPVFLVDGAHNPHGMRAAVKSLADTFPGKKLILIFGVLADKDYDAMLELVLPFAGVVLCVTPDNPRALKASDLAAKIQEHAARGGSTAGGLPAVQVKAMDSIASAIDEAFCIAGPEDVICAIGSLYMISDVRSLMKRNICDDQET